MHIALRLLALVVVGVFAFIVNAYAQQYWAGLLFPYVVPRPYTEMVSAALVGAVAAAAVSAWPLAQLFERKAWLAALSVTLPVVVLRAPELGATVAYEQHAVVVMALVEMLSYVSAVVYAAWLLSRRTRRAESAP